MEAPNLHTPGLVQARHERATPAVVGGVEAHQGSVVVVDAHDSAPLHVSSVFGEKTITYTWSPLQVAAADLNLVL